MLNGNVGVVRSDPFKTSDTGVSLERRPPRLWQAIAPTDAWRRGVIEGAAWLQAKAVRSVTVADMAQEAGF